MRKGLVFGCYDPLHYGHENLFSRCKELCDHLTVCVHTDQYIREWKHRAPFKHEDARCAAVFACKDVDEVALRDRGSRAEWAENLKVDVVFLSEEIKPDRLGIPDKFEVVHMPRTPGISSTEIRARA